MIAWDNPRDSVELLDRQRAEPGERARHGALDLGDLGVILGVDEHVPHLRQVILVELRDLDDVHRVELLEVELRVHHVVLRVLGRLDQRVQLVDVGHEEDEVIHCGGAAVGTEEREVPVGGNDRFERLILHDEDDVALLAFALRVEGHGDTSHPRAQAAAEGIFLINHHHSHAKCKKFPILKILLCVFEGPSQIHWYLQLKMLTRSCRRAAPHFEAPCNAGGPAEGDDTNAQPVKSILQQITGILKTPVGQSGVVSPGASGPPALPQVTEEEEIEGSAGDPIEGDDVIAQTNAAAKARADAAAAIANAEAISLLLCLLCRC